MKTPVLVAVAAVAVAGLVLYTRRASAATAAPAGTRANMAARRPLQRQGAVTRTAATGGSSYANPQATGELLARGVIGLTNFFTPGPVRAPSAGFAPNIQAETVRFADNNAAGNAGGLAAYFAAQNAGAAQFGGQFSSSDELDEYRDSMFLRNFASSDERDEYVARTDDQWSGPVVSAVDDDASYFQEYAQADGVLSGPVYDVSTDYVANPWTEWGSDYSAERGY